MSKSGRVCTHLGNAKGCDTSKARAVSAANKKARAINDENNKRIWAIVKDADTPEKKEQASRTLNFMGIRLPSGLEFTPKRVNEVRNRQMRMFRRVEIK